MRKCFFRAAAMAVSTLSGVMVVMPAMVSAGDDGPVQSQGGQRIVGTGDVHVTARSCQTGAEVRTFESPEQFNAGGTMQDVASGFAPGRQTPGVGVWKHLVANRYSFSFKSFGFDANGNFTGWTVVRHEVTLNPAASEFTPEGTAGLYDAGGNLLFTGCSGNTAARFE